MYDLNDLYFYVQVVKYGGFAPAGRALKMPKSKLSRHIAQLEERIGVRLINRSTRRFVVTEVGQIYYQHCEAMLMQADAAQDAIDITRTEPQGSIRLSCATGMLNFQVAKLLPGYMKKYPKVKIHLESTDRAVDVLKEGFDMAIRVRFPPLEDSDLVMKVLASSPQQLVASPELATRYGGCILPGDLSQIPTLDWGWSRQDHIWHLEGPDGATAAIHHSPCLVTDDMVTLREAALAGIGVVQLPLLVVHHDLMAGTLVPVVENWRPKSAVVHVVFPSRRGLLPSVRSFLDYLSDCFGELDFIGNIADE
ncbi:LysR family transcriptional regulator [Pragia fontium]|uniref:DNA-binding transcriptional regulator, LysR family n=2 Tax=Pragia fontium TaxID=82985 RepID=A0AAJ4WCY1_9GAMM|nr:LysR family transcriptional regulator [Pragia fontium]GKX64475.1 LysR family transcriptional regulator [Pragia fontium]SFD29628.1 DNA-binding transcriptional regulator, LysR family [Pragia fontium DSM 5563 = ATCC 49100]SUB83945.1 D-malate degradation protein R [Pragia fontium]VEJ56844.1 D-malate degradation protein R [Pragia fontium]